MRVDEVLLDRLVDVMFQRDDRGRLIGAAPLLHVVRTADHVIVRCHADLADTIATEMAAVAKAPRGKAGAWAGEYGRYLSLVASAADLTSMRAGPLFQFPEALADHSDGVAIDMGNSDLLKGALDEWVDAAKAGAPMVAALSDGRAVSICATVRASKYVHCAGVETAPGHRGRGLAGHAVIGWAKLVRRVGAEPFYATTFDNVPSQNLANRLGLKLIGSEFSIFGGVTPAKRSS